MQNTSAKVVLVTPLKRGDKEITEITLHKPNAGALRGVTLNDCLHMGTDAVVAVIPRISDPKVTPQEMQMMDPADLLEMGAALSNFFLKPQWIEAAKAEVLSLNE